MRNNTIQNIRYVRLRYDTIQHNTIQYNTIQYNTIQYNTIQYNIRYDTIRYDTIRYNTIQYNTIQYNTIQYNSLFTHIAPKSQRSSFTIRTCKKYQKVFNTYLNPVLFHNRPNTFWYRTYRTVGSINGLNLGGHISRAIGNLKHNYIHNQCIT